MTEQEAPLTERQQLMMAYVDDELSPQKRREFESLVATDPGRPVYERLGFAALLRLSMWMHA